MDYKTFLKELENIKYKFSDYCEQKIDKNVTRINKIVSEYLDDIKLGNYSIKSYKAKIIQKELENRHTAKELKTLHDELKFEFEKVFNSFFKDYQKVLENELHSFTKSKDIKERIAPLRKEKQNLISLKNNLIKDMQAKTKELDSNFEEKEKTFLDNITEINSKLNFELSKVSETTLKNYLEFEEELLETDSKEEIKDLKSKIKDVRIIGLKEELVLKENALNELLEQEIGVTENEEDYNYEKDSLSLTHKQKIIEHNYKIKSLDLEMDYIEKSYDNLTLKIDLESLQNDVNVFFEYLEKSNKYLENYEPKNDSKKIIFDFAKLNLYNTYINFKKNNIYSSLGVIINNIITKVDVYLEEVKKHEDLLLDSCKAKKYLLLDSLKEYDPDPRKVNKLEFIENIITTLQRYYDNVFYELELFDLTFYDMMGVLNNLLIKNINKLVNNFIPPMESKYLINNFKFDYVNIWNKVDSVGEYQYYTEEIIKLKNKINSELLNKVNSNNLIIEENELNYNDLKSLNDKKYEKDILRNELQIKKTNESYVYNKNAKLNMIRKNIKNSIIRAKEEYKISKKSLQ